MTDSKLLDSSIWLDYLFNSKHKDIVESNEVLLVSSLSLFEIQRKLIKEKVNEAKINKGMDFIKKRSLVIPVNTQIAEKAVTLSIQYELPAIDSLIYATGLINNALTLTLDNDFRGLKDAIVYE